MIRFLIDEDMPRSTTKLLRQAGFECLDVRDTELRGKKDNEMPTDKLNRILIETIKNIHEDIPGNLTIIEPDKVRIRRR